MLKTIDVFIPCASRPEFLEYTLYAFCHYVHFSGEFNFIFHDDVLDVGKSKRLEDVLLRFWDDGMYERSDPPIGLGPATQMALDNYITTPLFFYLIEDWEFERPVDLDHVIYLMERHGLNQIWFNKQRLTGDSEEDGDFKWSGLPSVNRTAFMKKHWGLLHPNTRVFDCMDMPMHKMKSQVYVDGPSFRYVRHLGDAYRVAPSKTKHNKGQPVNDQKDLAYHAEHRAPWLPPLPSRPDGRGGWFPARNEEDDTTCSVP